MTQTRRSGDERPKVPPEAEWWLTLSTFVDVCHGDCGTEFERGDVCVWNSTLQEKLCEGCSEERGLTPKLSRRYQNSISDLPSSPRTPLSRAAIRGVACPRCGALPGENCIGRKASRRQRNHLERMQAAQKGSK